MDLHDYKDVAENYDKYLDVMYQNEDNHHGFQKFYLKLAKEYGQNGVVDVACGTGAVLLYLAENGIDVDGTDISEEMCKVSLLKAKEKGLDLKVYPADMTKFSSGKKYSLAVIARSGFMHLPTPKLQRDALCNLREQLIPGGILTLNTFDPSPAFQAYQMQNTLDGYAFRLEYENSEGQHEKIYNAITYDPVTQIMKGNWKFETYDEKGNVIGERIRPLTMRQTYRQEMYYLAELCGFEVQALYQDYNFTPADEKNCQHNLIWILRKPMA